MLIVLLALRLAYAQYTSYNAVAGRLPGRCLPGDFDCGFGRCVPITVFHDGKPDCFDGSDEWCFFGQIKCGAYCIDMSQALSCLFSPKCDDSNRQPKWCAISKEKLCGDPSSFPCKGYGECVLWQWLLDGKKHCIDGSDEDQNYVRTMEPSFRCYYNRTKKIKMPPPLNYSSAFLKLPNPTLPGFHPPQFPTLFPPVPTLTLSPSVITAPPPVTLPPPVQLSKVTGLPPLPPPFPTLLPSDRSSQLISMPITQQRLKLVTTTVKTIFVPDSTSPSDPFRSPEIATSTSFSPSHPLDSDNYSSSQGPTPVATPSPASSTTARTSLSQTSTEQTATTTSKKHGYGHIRGRATTPTTTTRLTHIKVAVVDARESNTAVYPTGGSEMSGPEGSGSVASIPETSTASRDKSASVPKETSVTNEEGSSGQQPSVTHIDISLKEGIYDETFGTDAQDQSGQQPLVTHIDLASKEGDIDLVVIPQSSTPSSIDYVDGVLPTPSTNVNVPSGVKSTGLSASGQSKQEESGSSEIGPTSRSSIVTSGNKTVPLQTASESESIVKTAAQFGGYEGKLSLTTTTRRPRTSEQEICLQDLESSAKKQFPNYECRCPVGEMMMDDKCRAIEKDLVYYELDIHSACEQSSLTTEEKKWIAIGKLGETLSSPSCVRMNSNGDVVVNSICRGECDISKFRKLMKERPGDLRVISVEEAQLCDDSSSNYCHRYANCIVENVRLKCICRPGTNDTSRGLGKMCVGIPTDDECIMLLGACLIFWLVILLGLLLLIPLLIYLLSHCCPGKGNLIHPKEEDGRNGAAKDSRHIVAMMSSLLASNAGGARDLAMKMALAELNKGDKNTLILPESKTEPHLTKLEDGNVDTPTTVVSPLVDNNVAGILHAGESMNGAPLVMKEIDNIPGTIRTAYSETPILERVSSPLDVLPEVPPAVVPSVIESNPPLSTQKAVSQQCLTRTESRMTVLRPPTHSAPVVGNIVSLPREVSTPIPVAPPVSQPLPTPTPPSQTPPPHPPTPPVAKSASLPAPEPVLASPPPVTEPTLPAPHAPTVPPPAQVYCSSESREKRPYVRAISTHSVGVQPTIWESYKALGDVYAKQDKIDRQGSSSSLDTLIYSRYPHISTTLIDKKPIFLKEQRGQKAGDGPKTAQTIKTSAAQKASSSQPVSVSATTVPEVSNCNVETQTSLDKTSDQDRKDADAQVMAMLGVTLDDSSISSSSTTEKPQEVLAEHSEQSDEKIVEQMSREGVELPIGPRAELELSIDEKMIGATPHIAVPSHVDVETTTDDDLGLVPILPAIPAIPNVEITESDSKEELEQKDEKTPSTTVVSNNAVFVPKKAREKEKVFLKKPANREATGTREGSPQLLRPPDRTMQSSTEDSDPEVAAFKKLAKADRIRDAPSFTRKRPRRPERQLSSISEKSAEIAAEAALQNQPKDYSISAPNTTRSITEWHRYVPKETLRSTDGSDNQTDVDIPKIPPKRTSASKSKHMVEKQKKRRAHAQLLRESKSEPQPPRPLRSSEMPSASSAPHRGRRRYVDIDTSVISSPDIPDVTLRRSLDRLNWTDDSYNHIPSKSALTCRSWADSGTRVPKEAGYAEKLDNSSAAKRRSVESEHPKAQQGSDAGSSVAKAKRPSQESGTPQSSRTSHHALISRKIATRRHETHVTKSTGDLTVESRSSSSMSNKPKASQSADNLNIRPPWDSSPYKPDDKFQMYRKSVLPEVKITSKYYKKSRSVLNSPLGSYHRSYSKFSLTSLPARSSSTLDFSPYFNPEADSDKPPKEDLWWGPPPRSFR